MELSWERPCPVEVHAVFHSSMLWPPLCSLLHAVEIFILPGPKQAPLLCGAISEVPEQNLRLWAPATLSLYLVHHHILLQLFVLWCPPNITRNTAVVQIGSAGVRVGCSVREVAVATRVNQERWRLGCPPSLFILYSGMTSRVA